MLTTAVMSGLSHMYTVSAMLSTAAISELSHVCTVGAMLTPAAISVPRHVGTSQAIRYIPKSAAKSKLSHVYLNTPVTVPSRLSYLYILNDANTSK